MVHEASCIELLYVVPQLGTNEDVQGVVQTKPEAEVESIWTELEYRTTRHTRESPLETQQGQQAASGKSRSPVSFTQWINLHTPELEKWSQLYDTDGARYRITKTNMSEVYNSVLKGVRCVPITTIVEEAWTRTVGYFINRATVARRQLEEGK